MKFGLILAPICCIAFLLRVLPPFDSVFYQDWVGFQSTDPWYHMRHIESLVRHFPNPMEFDPYGFYPSGTHVETAPLFDFMVGFPAWMFGAWSPSIRIIETVGAYFPAVIGALVPIPMYFIAKALFGRRAGIVAALLIAILPGPFLANTLLGYTDHHSAEILFSVLVMLFFIQAINSAQHQNISLSDFRNKDWKALKRTLLYASLAGIALALYLLSWRSGSFLVFILFSFFTIQFSIDYLRNKTTDYLLIVGLPTFAIALFVILPFSGLYSLADLQVYSLVAGLLALLTLRGLAHVMLRHNINKLYYPVLSAAAVGIGILLLYFVNPDIFSKIVDKLGLAFNPTGTRLTIVEVGGLSISRAWEYFGPAFYIFLLSLIVLIYVVVKTGAPAKTLLVIWCLIVLIAAFGQQRLSYYLAINVALLTAYFCYALFEILWSNRSFYDILKEKPVPIDAEQKTIKKISRKEKRRLQKQAPKHKQALLSKKGFNTTQVFSAVLIVAVFFLIFYPNVSKAITWADNISGPDPDWREALVWMKDNTPEPFENSDFFYDYFVKPNKEQNIVYPKPSYGVMSWWDYGYWITYIAHRVPNATPGNRGRENAAEFLLSRDETTANALLDSCGSRYIVLDLKTAIPSIDPERGLYGFLYNIIEWAGMDQSEFYERYYVRKEGKFQSLIYFYPAYYQSMSTRLYFFKGEEVVPNNTTLVISYVEKTDPNGGKYKEITRQQRFSTYEEAKEYLAQNGSTNSRIVGDSVFLSPVPLDKLVHYKLVYESPTKAGEREMSVVYWVEVFEYDSQIK